MLQMMKKKFGLKNVSIIKSSDWFIKNHYLYQKVQEREGKMGVGLFFKVKCDIKKF
jgi:hypothetical protein